MTTDMSFPEPTTVESLAVAVRAWSEGFAAGQMWDPSVPRTQNPYIHDFLQLLVKEES